MRRTVFQIWCELCGVCLGGQLFARHRTIIHAFEIVFHSQCIISCVLAARLSSQVALNYAGDDVWERKHTRG